MKLQSCGTLHYINAIKGCSVIKISGVVFKNLKDIYEADGVPSNKELQDGCEDGVLNHTMKNSCLPMAKRMTSEREHEVNISDCSGNIDEIASGSDDLSFGEMTLKQLKKRCKTKKRKKSDFVCLSPKKELTDFLQDEDDCDLTTPLSSWNAKLSKSAKSKKKCAKSSANCAPMAIKVEVSPICCSELQIAGFATEAGYGSSTSEEKVKLFGMDSTKPLQTSDTALEKKEIISLAGQYETCVLNEYSYSQLDDDFMPASFLPPLSGNTAGPSTQERGLHSSVSSVSELHKEAGIMHSPSSQSFLMIDKPVYDNNLVISSQSSNGMQEIFGHGTGDQVFDVPLENGNCTETVHESELCILEDIASNSYSSNMFNSSQCCFSMPEILSNESGCLVSSAETDNSLYCIRTGEGIKLSVLEVIKSNLHHYLPNSFLRSPFCHYSSPWNFYPFSASDSDLVTLENDSPTIDNNWSLISNNSDTARNCLEPNIHLTDLEEASYANKEKQSLLLVNNDVEISFSSNAVNQLSTPETNNHYDMVLQQPPERFPSMRKAISPTSQEKLCLAMSSREMYDDIENYKCKGKLFFGNQTEDSTLSAASATASGESYMTDESTGKVTLTKAYLGPKKILKKPKLSKKGSPPKRCSPPKGQFDGLTKTGSLPKGRLEAPHLTRSLPGLCTGRTSIEACRESVIAFSQRQMQDIESIAVKLMTELKSMKDIVEEKFLDEAYHCTSMKHDADEVKSAIKNATRVEETTKKWLSMMARDCNRFCKIMSLPQRSTEDVSAATEDIMHREKKRISFADEVGGVLCHVKYFENGKSNTEVTS